MRRQLCTSVAVSSIVEHKPERLTRRLRARFSTRCSSVQPLNSEGALQAATNGFSCILPEKHLRVLLRSLMHNSCRIGLQSSLAWGTARPERYPRERIECVAIMLVFVSDILLVEDISEGSSSLRPLRDSETAETTEKYPSQHAVHVSDARSFYFFAFSYSLRCYTCFVAIGDPGTKPVWCRRSWPGYSVVVSGWDCSEQDSIV